MLNVANSHHTPAKALDLFCSRQYCRVGVKQNYCFLRGSQDLFSLPARFVTLIEIPCMYGSRSFVANPLGLQKSTVGNKKGIRQ